MADVNAVALAPDIETANVGKVSEQFPWNEPGAEGECSIDPTMGTQYEQEYQDAAMAAQFAQNAAYYATQLLGYVRVYQQKVADLESKVKELEAWKAKTSRDLNQLRSYFNTAKQQMAKVAPMEPAQPGLQKMLTMPAAVTASTSPVSLPVPKVIEDIPGPPLPQPLMRGKSEPLPEPPEPVVANGAVLRAPPGLDFPVPSPSAAPGLTGFMPEEGNAVIQDEFTKEGKTWRRAKWRIPHLSKTLREKMGRQLVSTPFNMNGLQWKGEEMRLMVMPIVEQTHGPRSRRQKDEYNKKVTSGPFHGCLQIKVSTFEGPTELTFSMRVGSNPDDGLIGTYTQDFGQITTSQAVESEFDWIEKVDPDQSLTVSVEIQDPD